jgi:hypothetical protein
VRHWGRFWRRMGKVCFPMAELIERSQLVVAAVRGK